MLNDNDLDIEDENDSEDAYHEYNLTSYPTDFTLAVLYDQWQSEDIVVPDYQRGYVWNINQASKLIESFLIGLPIPQVFLYVDDDHKLLVIDGQQRITSIAYFLNGYFGEEEGGSKKVFRLTGLSEQSPFKGQSFNDLDASVQRKLRGAPLRAINIRQLRPEEDNSSVYQIFERLNTGGTPLKTQEIRNAVFRGPLNELLKSFNELKDWRTLIGKSSPDKHMRDVELLLRVFALTYFREHYDGKMKSFLNKTMRKNKNANSENARKFEKLFPATVAQLAAKLPTDPFRRRGPINSAMLEAVLCAALTHPAATTQNTLTNSFQALIKDEDFLLAISQATNAVDRVQTRYERATKILFS